MTTIKLITLIAACSLLTACVGWTEEVPKGWFKAGKSPKDYESAIDREVVYNDKPSASLKSIVEKPAGFGTLMQMSKADTFRGKRVRFSGYIRSKDITESAGMWLRIDGPKGEPLGFDNMEKRPIKGTTEWKKYEIVLEVPGNAKELAFGLLLAGPGQIWMADLNFETVGKETPTTAAFSRAEVQAAPANLSFDK
jgi:hypothetical protein